MEDVKVEGKLSNGLIGEEGERGKYVHNIIYIGKKRPYATQYYAQ